MYAWDMPSSSTEVKSCRLCRSEGLEEVFDLGVQALTGVFPGSIDEPVSEGPVRLVLCRDCELLQLGNSFSPEEMYGDNYGYRSSLNSSMVGHLARKARSLEVMYGLKENDVVVDIGSNDATLLRSYSAKDIVRIGIDPVGTKFREYYPSEISLMPEFFDADRFLDVFGEKAKLITSIAMFYDLPDPLKFVKGISKILREDGLWHFEQSYLPSMLRTNSFDTVCHEHVEYYSLSVVVKLLESCGLKIIDVQMNSVNGGSFAVTAAKQSSSMPTNSALLAWLLDEEKKLQLGSPEPYVKFASRSAELKASLVELVGNLNASGKTVAGYGASTKGNVTLQYCGFTAADIPYIGEVNPYKFGRFTPGTRIPIVPETSLMEKKPDYLLILPWHFRESLVAKEREFLDSGGRFIIPFPNPEIIS